MDKESLKKVAQLTKKRYVEVKDGVVKTIDNDEIIPIENIAYQRVDEGFFFLTEATCGGSCKIGSPKERCVTRGMYSKNECAVYNLCKVGCAIIDIEELCKLLK